VQQEVLFISPFDALFGSQIDHLLSTWWYQKRLMVLENVSAMR